MRRLAIHRAVYIMVHDSGRNCVGISYRNTSVVTSAHWLKLSVIPTPTRSFGKVLSQHRSVKKYGPGDKVNDIVYSGS